MRPHVKHKNENKKANKNFLLSTQYIETVENQIMEQFLQQLRLPCSWTQTLTNSRKRPGLLK